MNSATSTNQTNETTTKLHISLMVIIPAALAFVASIGLLSGATLVISAERVSSKVVEEVIENRGIVTVPVMKTIDPGRVDITIRRKILGIIPWDTHRVEDVKEIDAISGRSDIRDSRGRISSSSSTTTLALTPRTGERYFLPSASGVLGTDPGSAAEQLRTFVDSNSTEPMTLWWSPWLENIVGLPFALIFLLSMIGYIKTGLRKLGILPKLA